MEAPKLVVISVEELETLLEKVVAKALAARPSKNILTLEEAAEMLGRHPKVLASKARDGLVPAQRLGRDWRFDAAELREWLKNQPRAWSPKNRKK